ncbi:hypothetical protein F2Q70_00007922 [Brassica cretica]|uniref:Profilin n=1 Tax=Brassica cretica TaxID=69181 RepID=A0A8S9M273_BRACR|nr:hypothetical protein F2Q70_00007922 [Brassica cretica]
MAPMKLKSNLKQLKLSVPAQETPISSFLTASGTFHDGDFLLNQKGRRLISDEKQSTPSDSKELDFEITAEDLETVKVIGKGSGGVVQLVRRGKKGAGGVTIKKTTQALVFGIYEEPVTPGQCNMVVERLGDYLIESGL